MELAPHELVSLLGMMATPERTQAQAVIPRRVKRRYTLTPERRAFLSCLLNPMLYGNLKKRLELLNPDSDVVSIIDRELEPCECGNQIRRLHPDIVTMKERFDPQEDLRDYLEAKGITTREGQRIAIKEMAGLTDEELERVGETIAEFKAMFGQ